MHVSIFVYQLKEANVGIQLPISIFQSLKNDLFFLNHTYQPSVGTHHVSLQQKMRKSVKKTKVLREHVVTV